MALDDGLLQRVMGYAAAFREAQAAVDPFQLFLVVAGPLFQAEEILLGFHLRQAAGQGVIENDQVVEQVASTTTPAKQRT